MTQATCSVLNMTFHEGRSFQSGAWSTQSDCALGQCNLQKWSQFGTNASFCASQTYCTQSCTRCATYQRNIDNSQRSFCYSNDTQQSCVSPGIWTNMCSWGSTQTCYGSRCMFSYDQNACAGANYTYRACDSQPQSTCGSANVTDPALQALQCVWSNNEACLTDQTCLASGQCNDWQFQQCTYPSGGGNPTCITAACVLPFTFDASGQQSNCANPSQIGCTDYTLTQPRCVNAGGTWHVKSTNSSSCLNQASICTDPKFSFNTRSGFNTQQCSLCKRSDSHFGQSPQSP